MRLESAWLIDWWLWTHDYLMIVRICISPSWTWNPACMFLTDAPFGPKGPWASGTKSCALCVVFASFGWRSLQTGSGAEKLLRQFDECLGHLILRWWISHDSWDVEVWKLQTDMGGKRLQSATWLWWWSPRMGGLQVCRAGHREEGVGDAGQWEEEAWTPFPQAGGAFGRTGPTSGQEDRPGQAVRGWRNQDLVGWVGSSSSTAAEAGGARTIPCRYEGRNFVTTAWWEHVVILFEAAVLVDATSGARQRHPMLNQHLGRTATPTCWTWTLGAADGENRMPERS